MSWNSYYKFWSSNSIIEKNTFFNNQETYNEKKNFFGTTCTDYRSWSADPSILQEVFYERIQQGYTNDNPSFVPFNEIYESLSIDKDRIIVKLSKGLEPHIEKRELIKLLNSNSYITYCDANNNNYNRIETCSHASGNVIHYNDTIPFEEIYKSLLNDKDKVIYGLISHLKYYISNDKMNKLINVKINDKDNIFNRLKCIILHVSRCLKNILTNMTFGLLQRYRNKCIQYKTVTYNRQNDKTQNVNHCNRSICRSKTSPYNNLKEINDKCTQLDSCKNQSTYIMHVNEHSCIKNKPVYDILLEMNRENNRLLREIRLKEVAKRNTLIKMRNMNKNLFKDDFLSSFKIF